MLPDLKSNFIIVLNDNTMSISKNVGGMSKLPEWASDDTGILRPEERCRRYDQEDSRQGRTDRPSGEEDEERDQTIICSGNVF